MILFEGIVKAPITFGATPNGECLFTSIYSHCTEWIVRVKFEQLGKVGDDTHLTNVLRFEGDSSLIPFVQDFLGWLVAKGFIIDVCGGYRQNDVVYYYNSVSRGRLEKLATFNYRRKSKTVNQDTK